MNKGCLFLSVLGLLFSSCLSGTAEISVSADGSVSAELSYQADYGFIGLGYLGLNELLLPLPVREEQFLELNNSEDAPSFTDVSVTKEAEDVLVSCALSAVNADQISQFWLRDSGSFQWEGGTGTLRLMLWQGFQEPLDELTIQRLRALSGGSPWRLTINLPGSVLSTNRGVPGAQANQLVLELDYNEIIIENNTIFWEITWQT